MINYEINASLTFKKIITKQKKINLSIMKTC